MERHRCGKHAVRLHNIVNWEKGKLRRHLMTGKGLIYIFEIPPCLWVCVLLPSTHLHSTLQSSLLQLPLSPIVSDTPQMPEVFGLKAPPPLWMGIWPFDKPSFIKTSAPSTHLSVDRSQPPSFFIWRQPPWARSPGLPSCQSSTLLRSRVILMATKRTHRVPLFKTDPRTG